MFARFSYTEDMLEPNKPSRARCERCLRPSSYCLCAHISRVSNRTQVLVLQHPTEAKHALNTARLAVLGLERAELLIGEHFPELVAIVAAAEQPLLLFPAQDSQSKTAWSKASKNAGAPSLVIVPDGTWRKARKIIHMNPVLETLPRLSLPQGAPSQYRVRKAPGPEAVSTIEAIVRALTMLEPRQDFQPLLAPFHVLIEQQIQAMGEDIYQRNYVRSRQ